MAQSPLHRARREQGGLEKTQHPSGDLDHSVRLQVCIHAVKNFSVDGSAAGM
jgi:hypothetical protein